jgi:hypothetical protein
MPFIGSGIVLPEVFEIDEAGYQAKAKTYIALPIDGKGARMGTWIGRQACLSAPCIGWLIILPVAIVDNVAVSYSHRFFNSSA